MNRIIAGFDPGSRNCGYAVLNWDGRRASWITGGKTDDIDVLDEMILGQNPDLIVIEWPHVGKRQAAKAVMATMAVAADLRGRAKARGLRVEEIPPHVWRKTVLGRTRRTELETIDAIAKRVLLRLIVGMPRRITGHAVDSCGVALCGARIWARRVA